MVLVLSMMISVADGASEIAVFKTVTTGPPGINVCVPATYSEAELGVKVVPASEIAGGCGVW